MEEEFYATLKLTSGEELLSKVCYMPEDNKLILDRPMLVEKITQKKIGRMVEGFILKEWIASTYDTMFVINMDQIITVTEMDKKIEVFYLKNLDEDMDDDDMSIDVKPKSFSRQMGYLGSVNDTKKYLEDVFNKS
jgi:hypothetical protein